MWIRCESVYESIQTFPLAFHLRLSALLFGFYLHLGTKTQWEETGWEAAAVVTRLQGLPSLFRKSKTALSNGRFVPSLRNMRACVFLHIHSNNVFMCMSELGVFFQLPGKLRWTESDGAECEKTLPAFLWADIRSAYRNPNQAITTKHTQRCWRTGRPAEQMLSAPRDWDWKWRDRQQRFESFQSSLSPLFTKQI